MPRGQRGLLLLASFLSLAACSKDGPERDPVDMAGAGAAESAGAPGGAGAAAAAAAAGTSSTADSEPATVNPFGVELEPESPLAGPARLSDVACLEADDLPADEWALHLASRGYAMRQGYSEAYLDAHFCPIAIGYEYHPANGVIRDYGYARVTYKVTFAPYVTWWQHHFPVLIDDTMRPSVIDGAAQVDESGEAAFVPELTFVPEIERVMSPEQLGHALEALIGPFSEPIAVEIGPNVGRRNVRLYATTRNDNPDATYCGERIRVGTVDVETGEGEVTFTGSCS